MSTTISQAERAKRNLQSVPSQVKNAKSRLEKALGQAGEEEREAIIAEFRTLLGGAEEEVAPEYDDSAAIKILSDAAHQKRDYDVFLRGFQEQAKVAEELQARAESDSARAYHARRIRTLNYLTRIVEAAMTLPEEPRTFGCRLLPRNKVSGRDTGFPDIQFRYHTYTTSDPLEIARLLDYMTNPSAGDAQIETLNAGDVAILNRDTSQVVMFVNGMQADDIVKNSGGTLRRAFI